MKDTVNTYLAILIITTVGAVATVVITKVANYNAFVFSYESSPQYAALHGELK